MINGNCLVGKVKIKITIQIFQWALSSQGQPPRANEDDKALTFPTALRNEKTSAGPLFNVTHGIFFYSDL